MIITMMVGALVRLFTGVCIVDLCRGAASGDSRLTVDEQSTPAECSLARYENSSYSISPRDQRGRGAPPLRGSALAQFG